MIKKFILLVIYGSLSLLAISLLLSILHDVRWIYLVFYTITCGLIPGGLAYLVLTGRQKVD